VVLGLPRGGVPVAYEVALALHAPLDVAIVRKIRAPSQPELAIGAVGEGVGALLNTRVIESFGLDRDTVREAEATARTELAEQVRRLRGGRPPVPLDGTTAVVVDDGVATGATAREAAIMARARGAARVVVATPVGPVDLHEALDDVADAVVCLETPEPFEAVGCWYRDFRATSTAEVVRLLDLARARQG
jgi:putative phosphoribosyl transferase